IIKHSRDYDAGQFPELAEYCLKQRPPLEAQLIDAADEIAYNCADLDDAVEAGLVDAGQVREAVPLFDRLWAAAERECPGAGQQDLFNEALRTMLDALVSGLIEGPRAAAAGAAVRTVKDVRLHPRRLAVLTEDARAADGQLKRFLQQYVYAAPSLLRERERCARKVTELFQLYLQSP